MVVRRHVCSFVYNSTQIGGGFVGKICQFIAVCNETTEILYKMHLFCVKISIMKTVIFETEIHCTKAELFDFHATIENLPLITPPHTHVEVLSADKVLKKGSRAILKISRWPLSIEWEVCFERWDAPHVIVDTALRSPLRLFRHEHRFVEIDRHRTLLRDTVTYDVGFGPLGTLAEIIIAWELRKMFEYRHEQTRAYFC